MGMARSRPHSSMGMARSASSELTARTCRLRFRFAYDTVSPIVDSERSGEWSGEVGDSYNRGNHCYIIVFIFLRGLHNEARKHSVIISKSIID